MLRDLLSTWRKLSKIFFRPTPGGSRQVVYQAGKTIAFWKIHRIKAVAMEETVSFLEGPFFLAEEVTEALGHTNWRVMRRFVTSKAQS
jgi:hypothetical protein